MHAGGSGIVLLAAFIMRPQSESQIGAGILHYTVESGLGVLAAYLARFAASCAGTNREFFCHR